MMDPATTQAVAKATEEAAKTAGKALDIAHDTGGYLKSVFGDLVTNALGWIIGDWVGQKRLRNFDALCRRTLEILHERNVNTPIELSPNQATELLTAAQDESRPELAELWARLLANAMDPNLNNIRHSFIDAVKNMDPPDAVVLRYLRQNDVKVVTPISANVTANITWTQDIARAAGYSDDEVQVSLRHLEALSFFDKVSTNRNWYTNAICREFMRACYPGLNGRTDPPLDGN